LYKTCTNIVVQDNGGAAITRDPAGACVGASSGIRTQDLCITKEDRPYGIGSPMQDNAAKGNELAPEERYQPDPSEPTFGHTGGPQSGPHSGTPAEPSLPMDPGMPSDLAKIVDAWPDLPEHIRAAMRTLVESTSAPSGGPKGHTNE